MKKDDRSVVDILLISTNSDLSGAPKYVENLALAATRGGYKVAVACGGNGPVLENLRREGLDVIGIPSLKSTLNPLCDFLVFCHLVNVIWTRRPSLIHSHSSKAGLHGRLLSLISRARVLFTVHGWGFGDGRKPHLDFLMKIIERTLVPLTDLYITVSCHDRKVGLDSLGISERDIVTVYPGSIDLGAYQRRPEERTVLMVARFSYQKDFQTLFRAIEGTDLKLVLVGPGTDGSECKLLAGELCPDKVPDLEFLGVVDDVHKIARRARVMVLTSRYEGLPVALVEAQSMGIPVIATRVGGIPEVIHHGKNGYLFQSGDHLQLREYLYKLMSNRVLEETFGDGARASYEKKFRLEYSNTAMLEIYKNQLSLA